MLSASAHVEVVRVGTEPATGSHLRYRLHVGLVELEIEDVDVLANSVGVNRLGDHHIAELNVPAQHHLPRRTGLAASDVEDVRIFQQPLALPERPPRFGQDAVRGVELPQLLLREFRVQLHLVNGRRHVGLCQQSLQVRDFEVRHPDRQHPSIG